MKCTVTLGHSVHPVATIVSTSADQVAETEPPTTERRESVEKDRNTRRRFVIHSSSQIERDKVECSSSPLMFFCVAVRAVLPEQDKLCCGFKIPPTSFIGPVDAHGFKEEKKQTQFWVPFY